VTHSKAVDDQEISWETGRSFRTPAEWIVKAEREREGRMSRTAKICKFLG
jgi:hypothetical protein